MQRCFNQIIHPIIGFIVITILQKCNSFLLVEKNINLGGLHSFNNHKNLHQFQASALDKAEELNPENNPNADLTAISPLSGVPFISVFSGLEALYPPEDLQTRNAVSRTDGYWAFINEGKKPPQHLTYGEFDFFFFAELLDRANYHYYNGEEDGNCHGWDDKVFADIGSGTGRLVLSAAALHPGLKLCRGIEVLPGIHDLAMKNLQKCKKIQHSSNSQNTNIPKENNNNNNNPKRPTMDSTKLNVIDENMTDEETNDSPLSSPMDSIKDILEGMSQEEWKELLGDQYEEFMADEEDEEASDGDNENMDTFDSSNDHEHVGTEIVNTNDIEENSDDDDVLDVEDEYVLKYAIPSNLDISSIERESELPLAPINFECASFEDPYLYLGDVDVVFIFSSCMGKEMLQSLSQALGRGCKPGSIIITTDYTLPLEGYIEKNDTYNNDPNMPYGNYKLELVESINGWCWLTGGESTAHIHRVVESLWDDNGPRKRPELTLEQKALQIVDSYESGTLTDTEKFLRDVRNRMSFHGLPEEWKPKIKTDENS